jgi:hypothetical protein
LVPNEKTKALRVRGFSPERVLGRELESLTAIGLLAGVFGRVAASGR